MVSPDNWIDTPWQIRLHRIISLVSIANLDYKRLNLRWSCVLNNCLPESEQEWSQVYLVASSWCMRVFRGWHGVIFWPSLNFHCRHWELVLPSCLRLLYHLRSPSMKIGVACNYVWKRIARSNHNKAPSHTDLSLCVPWALLVQ